MEVPTCRELDEASRMSMGGSPMDTLTVQLAELFEASLLGSYRE